MDGSPERVRRVLALEKPDRAPLFDLLPNDAVLQHFNGGEPVAVGDDASGIRAVAAAIDGTRVSAFSPSEKRVERLSDGRACRHERWTTWTAWKSYSSSEEYREVKERELSERRRSAGNPVDPAVDQHYLREREIRSLLGDDFCYVLAPPHQSLMGIWTEVGLEQFSYYLYDCEELIVEQLELNTEYACRWIEGLPGDDPFEAAFIGDDIAFKTGSMISVEWLQEHYFPRLARVVTALHARGLKAMYHSDGNLNAIMDGLVEAGIDALNPIEVSAGMDLGDLHRRYPQLVFAGGIDVSHLLPYGTPEQIRDATVKAIEETAGRILVGSSTEVFSAVPLENFLAMREAAMGYVY
jgi:hypothetical protein